MYIETEIVSTKEISLSEFIQDISVNEKYIVDVNSLLDVCGASPVHVHYETDKISVYEFHPERIVLKNGRNSINISMITKIIKREDDLGITSYEIHCGDIESLKEIVVITQT